jgi:hypothetical protein
MMGCGEETFFGRCDDNTLIYCDEDANQIISADCGADNGDGISLSCSLINDDYGYDCESDSGSYCYFDEGANFCGGEDSACVLLETEEGGSITSACTESVGACDSANFAADDSMAQCNGKYLYIGCTIDQPFAFDCNSFNGGTCEGSSCVLVAGEECDDEFFTCAEGLTCMGLTDEEPGVCSPAE